MALKAQQPSSSQPHLATVTVTQPGRTPPSHEPHVSKTQQQTLQHQPDGATATATQPATTSTSHEQNVDKTQQSLTDAVQSVGSDLHTSTAPDQSAGHLAETCCAGNAQQMAESISIGKELKQVELLKLERRQIVASRRAVRLSCSG